MPDFSQKCRWFSCVFVLVGWTVCATLLSASEGQRLFRQLQCHQCHAVQGLSLEPDRGSDLDLQKPFLQPNWIVDSLQATHYRRFGATMQLRLTTQDAEWFAERFGRSSPVGDIQNGRNLLEKSPNAGSGNITAGQALLERIGCLACHQVGSLGRSNVMGGRELTDVAKKRPADFFAVWLRAPETIHPHHQMPVFQLSEQEISDLARYLSSLETPANSDTDATASETAKSTDQANVVAPEVLAGRSCRHCHASDSFADTDRPARTMLSANSRWNQSCIRGQDSTGPPWQPRYVVSDSQRTALQDFVSSANVKATAPDEGQNADSIATAGQELFETIGCLNCHARNDTPGLSSVLVDSPLAENPDVPLAALSPPSLNRIGDKLTDDALRTAITRAPRADLDDSPSSTRRPWLHVRMPRFRMNELDLTALMHYLISVDRKHESDLPRIADDVTDTAVLVAGQRLVSSAGFGCVSCHIIGDSSPASAPVNALGPDLTGLAQRIRPAWFYEWVRDPAKLVPRIEMPAIQRPVAGVLQDDLDQQLAAVWQTLNTDNLTLPPIDPVRTVRRSGQAAGERSVVLTDVIRLDDGSKDAVRLVKPFLIGLPNRHNVLFDLETAQLSHWTAGDTAYQRTEGKTWFWTLAGTPVWNAAIDQPDLQMRLPGGRWLSAIKNGQFVTEPDAWRHANGGVELDYRLLFRTDEQTDVVVRITQSFVPIRSKKQSGFRRSLRIDGLPIDATIRWRIVDPVPPKTALRKLTPASFRLTHRWHDVDSIIDVISPQGTVGFDDAPGIFAVDVAKNNQIMQLNADYKIDLTLDSFAPEAERFPLSTSVAGSSAWRLDVVPGFAGRRMWLPVSLMPTGIAWRPNGDMVVSSLKGRIWTLRDLNADGEYDVLIPTSDDLPAPYGLYADQKHVDVVTKFGVVRLHDFDQDGQAESTEVVASGWGHTADYHDWAVGLVPDGDAYWVALPCQQDQRTAEAAKYRGHVVRLVPSDDDPDRIFQIESVSAGHRFPMGIAQNRAGDIFVTDNQGNYNPFNELNHVRQGLRFGFINALEKSPDFHPPLTPPAIDIPHPWTRSVNGICFLDSKDSDEPQFGPFEGHLIGCEYDTRRLVRMTLQRVGDSYQGAVYPFSLPTTGPDDESGLLGPITAAVSPNGELVVGELRDSGWGGAPNIGQISRFRFRADKLGSGIREVRTEGGKIQIEFFGSVDAKRMANKDNYAIASYTRVSTPAYGGDDRDRQTETIGNLQVLSARIVALDVGELKPGYVYELHLQPLTEAADAFFTAEAYLTVR